MELLNLYLRKEPTTDALTLKHNAAKKLFDVVAYRDEACTTVAARWMWFYSTKPRQNANTVIFNCFTWKAVWQPQKKEAK